METLLISIAIFAAAAGLSFLLIKFGPPIEVREYKPCKHENVEQTWYDRQILHRECLDCGKYELSRNNTPSGFIKLWNPKIINGEPIRGIELKKMEWHKEWLKEKKKKYE